MICNLIFLSITVTNILGAPTSVLPLEKQQPTVIAIVSQSEELEPNGTYKFSYETGNGIKREETSYDKIIPKAASQNNSSEEGGESNEDDNSDEIHVQRGSYSYTAPDGTVITLSYIADENGFQPVGNHIPRATQLPTPISGLKSIAMFENVVKGRRNPKPDSVLLPSIISTETVPGIAARLVDKDIIPEIMTQNTTEISTASSKQSQKSLDKSATIMADNVKQNSNGTESVITNSLESDINSGIITTTENNHVSNIEVSNITNEKSTTELAEITTFQSLHKLEASNAKVNTLAAGKAIHLQSEASSQELSTKILTDAETSTMSNLVFTSDVSDEKEEGQSREKATLAISVAGDNMVKAKNFILTEGVTDNAVEASTSEFDISTEGTKEKAKNTFELFSTISSNDEVSTFAPLV